MIVLDTTDQSAFLDYVQCSGNHVYFSSSSDNAPLYRWNFGDPADPAAHAFGASVDHTYAAPGNYEVTVTLPPSVACPEALVLPVEVTDPTIAIDFSWSFESCGDSAIVLLQSEATNAVAAIDEWNWLIGNELELSGESVSLTIDESTIVPVILTITSANGCVDSLTDLLDVPLIDLELLDSLQICPGTSASLNPGGNLAYEYQWSPADGLNDAGSANPLASPEMSMLYSVTVTDPGSICEETGSVYVSVPPPFTYELTADSAFCADEASLFVESSTEVEVIWALDDDFTQVISLQPTFTTSVGPQSTFFVQLTDAFGCQQVDEVHLDNQSVQLLLDPVATVCIGDTLPVECPILRFVPGDEL